MTTKIKVDKIVEAMKQAAKAAKPKPNSVPFNPLFKPKDKPTINERDMRKEAMDMGSHGAKDYFGDGTQ